MLGTTQNLPGDIAELRAILAVRDEEIAASKAEIRVRDLLIEKLKHQLAGLRRHRFGSSSEALDQLALTLEDEEIAAFAQDDGNAIKADQPAAPKDKPKRKPLPEHLPRNEEILSPGRRLWALRRQTQETWGRCHRRIGICPWAFRGEPHRASAHGLPLLREDRSGRAALAPD